MKNIEKPLKKHYAGILTLQKYQCAKVAQITQIKKYSLRTAKIQNLTIVTEYE